MSDTREVADCIAILIGSLPDKPYTVEQRQTTTGSEVISFVRNGVRYNLTLTKARS